LELQSRLRFELPADVQVSAPWALSPEQDGSFVLDERAFAFTGHVVLGELQTLSIPAPGTLLRATIMPGFSEPARARIAAWLERSAAIASLPGGVFPVPDAQVIVVPTSLSSFPIHFGHTGRSGRARPFGDSISCGSRTNAAADLLPYTKRSGGCPRKQSSTAKRLAAGSKRTR
jgi:hypothetical protein